VGDGVIGEVDFDPTNMQGALRAGLEALDQRDETVFVKYDRVVLPLDGFVFWKPTTTTVKARGMLHFAQEWQQDDDQAIGYTRIVFTSEDQVQEFSQLGQNAIFVATYKSQGQNATDTFKYAFSAQGGFNVQAGLWHYVGHQIPPALLTQLLDPGTKIDQTRAVVSNSLPLWLQLNGYTPPYPGVANSIPVYPSYQAAENQPAPYIVVDVLETEPLNSAPVIGVFGDHSQWAKDTCRLTLYGLQNNEALTFQDVINQYSLDTDNFGIMNMPVVKDAHRVQAELHGIAMKKEMTVEVSYNQQTSTSTAHQLIEKALYSFYVQELFQPEDFDMRLIPKDVSDASAHLGANGLVAGILNDQIAGTTVVAGVWAKYDNGGATQAINLIAALNAINAGSGVDWSFLSAATLVELEWDIFLQVAVGETNINPSGDQSLDAQTTNAASDNYDVISTVLPIVMASPATAAFQIQLTGRTIAPVEGGVVHLTAGISALLFGQNAFSNASSLFNVVCRVVGWQV